jgi:hypothetical protein
LCDVARGVEESNAGVCTRYLLDELERKGPPGEDEIAMFDAERFVDRYDASPLEKELGAKLGAWRARMKRARRALALLSGASENRFVAVLHVAYGYPDPSTREWPKTAIDFLGAELTPLVRYVDATEVIRRQLVREGVPKQRALASSWVTRFALRRVRKQLEVPELIDLMSHRAAERYLDAIISSGDALRFVFGGPSEPHPKREPEDEPGAFERRAATWNALRDAHNARRTSFLVQARVEADRLLSDASRAYLAAWRASK